MSAVGYTSGDPKKVSKTGDTMTGALAVPTLTVGGYEIPLLAAKGRPPIIRPATTIYNMQTGHGWSVGGSGTASSDANDTTTFVRGTQSVRVTTNGTAVQSNVRKVGQSAFDLTGKMLRLVLKVDDVTNLDRIQFYVGTSNLANFFQWTVHTHSTTSTNYVRSGEWAIIHLSWADIFTASGSYSITAGAPSTKTAFTDMSFALYDRTSSGLTYHLQSVEIVPDTSITFPNGVVSLTFDDSWTSQYTYARSKMDQYGYRGTAYTIADYIDSNPSNYMTMSQLKALRDDNGWDVAGHAATGNAHGQTNGYEDLTAAQVHTEFRTLKAWMAVNGFHSDHFAYPKGRFSLTSDGVPIWQIAQQYWNTSRSIISEAKEVWPPAMPQMLKCLTGVSDAAGNFNSPTQLASSGGHLDKCQTQSDWLILCLHKIVTGTPADATECTQTGFNSLIDAIASRGIAVLPVAEVVRYYS